MTLPIFIPSRSRADRVRTLEVMDEEMRCNTTLVVPSDQVEDYSRRNKFVTVQARPDYVKNVAMSRQYILETAPGPFIMLDDDLKFFRRASPERHNLVQIAGRGVQEIWDRMERLIDAGWDLVGLSPRQMNNAKFPNRYEVVTRQNAVHCINPEPFLSAGIRFDTVPVMEDYYFVLSAFTEGIPNVAIVDAAWDQWGASGAAGGASTYRTADLQDQTALKMAELFPHTVKAVVKDTVGGLFAGQDVHDVRIQWRKQWKINHGAYPKIDQEF